MYDKSLEQLIDAVIADGVITDQERKVVLKKASSLGIDQDEIEVYLEGRLASSTNIGEQKSNKHGSLKTCPNCGATIKSFEIKCHECGHEFQNIGAVDSMDRFFKRLTSLKTNKQKCELIKTYPIPNDKESLLEFLSVSVPNSKPALGAFDKGFARWIISVCFAIIIMAIIYILFGYDSRVILPICMPVGVVITFFCVRFGEDNSCAKAWEIKTEAALNKIKILSHNNACLKSEADLILSDYKRSKTKRGIILSFCVVITIIISLFAFYPAPSMNDVNHLISNDQYEEAENAVEQLIEHGNSWEEFENYEEFMRLCIINMCKKGEYEEAEMFLMNKEKTLNNKSRLNDTDKAMRDLRSIIREYKLTGHRDTSLSDDKLDE